MKLLHGDVIAVHEEVQEVDGQVSGCGAEPEVVADDGNEVSKVTPEAELRGLSFVGGQLELLLENTGHVSNPDHGTSHKMGPNIFRWMYLF